MTDSPPVPEEGSRPVDSAWADYYVELIAWVWSTWRACGPKIEREI